MQSLTENERAGLDEIFISFNKKSKFDEIINFIKHKKTSLNKTKFYKFLGMDVEKRVKNR